MNDKTAPLSADAQRHSDVLRTELLNVKNAPVLKRGEAALRLAAMTVAALGHLETRIETLEAASHDS